MAAMRGNMKKTMYFCGGVKVLKNHQIEAFLETICPLNPSLKCGAENGVVGKEKTKVVEMSITRLTFPR